MNQELKTLYARASDILCGYRHEPVRDFDGFEEAIGHIRKEFEYVLEVLEQMKTEAAEIEDNDAAFDDYCDRKYEEWKDEQLA